MEQCLPVMTEKYRKTNYPKGIFAQIKKRTARISVMVYIFFGVILFGSGYGTVWALNKVQAYRQDGAEDMVGTGYGIAVFFGVFALISLACIIITIVRHARGAEKWKAKCAKQGGYTVSDMEQFEHQLMDTECRVVKLLNKVKAASSGQYDGVLTNDYLYLGDNSYMIVKLSDISAACLVDRVISLNSTHSEMHVLMFSVLTKKGTRAMAECSAESGAELMDFLKAKLPDIYTADGEVIAEKDFERLS